MRVATKSRTTPIDACYGQLTATLLLIGSTFFVPDGIQTIAAGALRGMNDTWIPLVIAIISYRLIGFAAAHVPAFGVVGVWIRLAIGTAVYATLLILRSYLHVNALAARSISRKSRPRRIETRCLTARNLSTRLASRPARPSQMPERQLSGCLRAARAGSRRCGGCAISSSRCLVSKHPVLATCAPRAWPGCFQS